ncbi:MAG: phosphate transport system regulatory protein PhoU [Propionibacterium sp.]|nr:MAG: phosphate transport system regulatory protein PhoU [Propionibacterium sp.]
MRESYHHQLDAVLQRMVQMADLVSIAVGKASAALLEADISKAEEVITDDAQLDAMHEELEFACLSLLARQAPVAGELRTIVSAIRVVFELARMGDLSAHIAKISRLRYPNSAVPEALRENFVTMSQIAQTMIDLARHTLAERDAKAAEGLAIDDEKMDQLRRIQFQILLSEDWDEGVEKAVDTALLGRYYERLADHAVAVGRRVIYIITGEVPQGEEWPNA